MRNAPTPEETLAKTTLLLVEDDDQTASDLQDLLRPLTREFLHASDGSQGLKIFRERRPDMVLTALTLPPSLDGISLATILKTHAPDTPVLALVSQDEEPVLFQAVEAGIDGCLRKPLDRGAALPVLYRHARHALHRRQEEARAALFSYLLDINPHCIISTREGRMDYANRTCLQHLGHETLESLLEGRPGSRTSIHMAGENIPLHDFTWLDILRSKPGRQHTVCFSTDGEPCSGDNMFWVTHKGFPELDREVVTFTDITPLEQERVQLIYRATTDSLTGVANRYKLSEAINTEHVRFRRYGAPLSLIMFDIDHFKAVNDTHGHMAGDLVLQELAGLVLRNIRDTDALGRWGGEEFMILSPYTVQDDALELAGRLCEIVSRHPFAGAPGVTCSFGVAQARQGESLQTLLQRVDQAVYLAKRNGRNRVEAA
ncbi:putative diguanylate cyclase YdaM [Fundidesulfovibrio magnetotacticus]|uniref:diguanylate cyclase n=1 Tax=Fundidesulfovibrio magnetotacticus TaxID=2730080 RepID=A0A6V8LR18_9BACT|nr:diguanylate cyclase [Fundidesulfovibrio magnetotacticus]GFK92788.1 putative diguanylate cyclase YdaM [Fundidesulfovibrio magnetotacticus]